MFFQAGLKIPASIQAGKDTQRTQRCDTAATQTQDTGEKSGQADACLIPSSLGSQTEIADKCSTTTAVVSPACLCFGHVVDHDEALDRGPHKREKFDLEEQEHHHPGHRREPAAHRRRLRQVRRDLGEQI